MKIRFLCLTKPALLLFLLICFSFLLFQPSISFAKPNVFPVAVIADLTGPYAPTVGPFSPGVEDGIQYINEELGGIDGVKMKAYIRDNTGKASLGLQQYAELVELKPKALFMAVAHAPTAEAVTKKTTKDGIILYCGATVPSLYPAENAYGFYPLYEEMIGGAVKIAREKWDKKRNPRAAILTWDTSYGRSMMTQEFYDYCKKINVDIVAKELFSIRDIDVTTQMVRIKSKKPDWIMTCIAGGGYMLIMKTAQDLGMNVKMVTHVGIEAMIRVKPELFEGAIYGTAMRSFHEKNHPGINKIKEYMKKNGRSSKEEVMFYTLGWEYALIVHKVVSDAVKKVGWSNLNTEILKKEMSGLTDFMPLDGIVKTTYTPKRRTTTWGLPCEVVNGQIQYLLDPKGVFIDLPDLRPAEYR